MNSSERNSARGDEKKQSRSTRDRILEIAQGYIPELIQDEVTGDEFAVIHASDHSEVVQIDSNRFQDWLRRKYYQHQSRLPSDQAVTEAMKYFRAIARFNPDDRRKLYVRVAHHDEVFYYDLCTPTWENIKITTDGWSVEKSPPPIFQRWKHMSQQVTPVQEEGEIGILREYINITSEKDWLILKTYLVTCLLPDISHPILVLVGPQGSVKSTVQRMLRELIDPSGAGLLSRPKSPDDAVTNLNANYVSYFDNVSTVKRWWSDLLCRASTGEGYSKRQLFTDREQVVFNYRRCVGINTISGVPPHPDFMDRAIIIEMKRVPHSKRKREEAIEKEFKKSKPRILAGLFNALSKAMSLHEQVIQEIQDNPEVRIPRMADFAIWGETIARAMGHEKMEFLEAYHELIEDAETYVMEENPIGLAVRALMETNDKIQLTPKELLERLELTAEEHKIDTNHERWPKNASWVTRRLKLVDADLADFGIKLDFTKRTGTQRLITITRIEGEYQQALKTQPVEGEGTLTQAKHEIENTLKYRGVMTKKQVREKVNLTDKDFHAAWSLLQDEDTILKHGEKWIHREDAI